MHKFFVLCVTLATAPTARAQPAMEKTPASAPLRVVIVGHVPTAYYDGDPRWHAFMHWDHAGVTVLFPKNKTGGVAPAGLAVEGRLTLAEEKLVEHFGLVDGVLELASGGKRTVDRKVVVLDADKVTELDDKNKSRFPPQGKAVVTGKAVCGKKDLKLVDEELLAFENGPVPIVCEGEKARATTPGKIVQVTGSFVVDTKRPYLRLKVDDVREAK